MVLLRPLLQLLIAAPLFTNAAVLFTNDRAASYPPASCSCACCVVTSGTVGCDMPGPTHWKHHGCSFGLCGDGAVLGAKGPEFAQKQKAAFCSTHCAPVDGSQAGDSCRCKSDLGKDPWDCPQ